MKRQRALYLQESDIDALIQLVRSGDCDAFSELMGRYDSLIRRTANSILRNGEDAEDATQETYLKIFTKIHTFEGASKFSTWLTRIAINTSLMRLRQRRCRPTSSIEELTDGDASSFLPLADIRLDPEQQSCTIDMRRRLYEAVRRLPSHLREIAEDHIYLELSMKDLAEKRSLSIAAAKSRAHRARKLLAGPLNPSRSRLTPKAP